MKTISLLIIAIAFGLGATAQTTSDTGHHKMNHHYAQSGNHSYYTMQDGKLMMSKNGTMSAVSNDVTLDNGTTISTDGKVSWKNGKTQTLTNGERIGTNGKVWGNSGKMHSNGSHMHKSKSMSDSTR